MCILLWVPRTSKSSTRTQIEGCRTTSTAFTGLIFKALTIINKIHGVTPSSVCVCVCVCVCVRACVRACVCVCTRAYATNSQRKGTSEISAVALDDGKHEIQLFSQYRNWNICVSNWPCYTKYSYSNNVVDLFPKNTFNMMHDQKNHWLGDTATLIEHN